jgi:pimeloyl-ACP methyl ester carboxylesterase
VRGLALASVLAAASMISPRPPPAAMTWINPTPQVTFEAVRVESGSRLAVARFGPKPTPERPPLIFLHGGPGSPPQAASVELLEKIAAAGVPVVLFHQAGVGLSDRLAPRDYTLDRAVADLEGLRRELGAPRVTLLGGSYGARLAYEYVARHPEHVARIIVTASAPLEPAAWRLDFGEALASRARPAWLFGIATASLGFSAPLALLPRAELDQAMALDGARAAPMLYCQGSGPLAPPAPGTGYDAAQFLALRADLARRPVPSVDAPPPALVLRPECDVMPWAAARDYRDRLHATVVMVPGMGHVVGRAQLDTVASLVVAFLEGRPLPLPAWQGDGDPAQAGR